MKFLFQCIIFCLLLVSCGAKNPKILSSSTNSVKSSSGYTPFFDITAYSEDEEYGLIGEKPVKVGEMSVQNQLRYLSSLAGPNGEELKFHRRGSCCGYKSEGAAFGSALVDVYDVTYDGLKKPIQIYISFYDFETLYIPKGFTKRL
ncbi:hypothetical protein [Sediminibacter sp. Hel_I_10]|uniref:hypothetical protein n=1 Tax=Sediminibacter sp. Hel_I_10 TaxID=1392490 RepID=UPI001E500727|nr:hypothetical protein [Sediminibacter sp. Hel_I_10]